MIRTFQLLSILVAALGLIAPARSQCTWAQNVRLSAYGGHPHELFGFPVAVSGEFAVLGATGDSTVLGGSAYVFRRSGASWAFHSKLVPHDPEHHSGYGAATAIDGDRIVVGAPYQDAQGYNTGAAYVFRWDGSAWVEEAKLISIDGFRKDYFGGAVAIDGDTVLVGANGDFENSVAYNGSAYFFDLVGGTWVQVQKVLPVPGGGRDLFGRTTVLQGDMAVIGAPFEDAGEHDGGAAYVYERDASGWTFTQKIIPPVPEEHAVFAAAIALDGGEMLIGMPHYDDGKTHFAPGSVHAYRRTGASWSWIAELAPPVGADGDYYGFAVSLLGSRAAVGSHGDEPSGFESGSAYVYELVGGAWQLGEHVLPDHGQQYARFALSVALAPDALLCSAPRERNDLFEAAPVAHLRAPDPGALHVFDAPAAPGYGSGCAGSLAAPPTLGVFDCPTPGSSLTLRVAGGAAGASAWVLVGQDEVSLPMQGGCLQLVGPIVEQISLAPLDAQGESLGTFTVPPALPPGSQLVFQAFVSDALAPQGFANSAGARIIVQ